MASYTGRVENAVKRLDKEVREELAYAVDNVAEITRKKFVNATVKWKNKPAWIKKPVAVTDSKSIRKQVIASGSAKVLAIFGWVDEGTEAHVILPKKPGGMLRFNVGYSAKTAPVANSNVGTGVATGDTVFSRGVIHPGTEARDFSAFFALEARPLLARNVREVIKRINRRRK